MSDRFFLQVAAYLAGVIVCFFVLRNPKTQEVGIGNQTRQVLAMCLIGPILLSLGLENVLSGEAIAALIGALIGVALPRGAEK